VSTETTNARALAAMLRERQSYLGHDAVIVHFTVAERDAIAAELERLADLEAARIMRGTTTVFCRKCKSALYQEAAARGACFDCEPLGELSDGA
jgi:hypothetical protein